MAKKEGFVVIHGKEYETVASRVNRFRSGFPDHTLASEIVMIDQDQCIVKAYILNPEGRLIANGHAQEFRASSQINKTSYVENCETSAIGRALAAFGIGGTEFLASANEVSNAIHQQNNPPKVEPPKDITPNSGALDGFDADELKFLNEQYEETKIAFASGDMDTVMQIYDSLDNDEKKGLWALLKPESFIRTAITKFCNQRKEAA